MTQQVIYKRGDTLPPLEVTLSSPAGEVDLTGAEILLVLKPLGSDPEDFLEFEADLKAETTNVVRREWEEHDLDTPDYYLVEWQVTYSDNNVETFPGEGVQGLKVLPDLNPESGS